MWVQVFIRNVVKWAEPSLPPLARHPSHRSQYCSHIFFSHRMTLYHMADTTKMFNAAPTPYYTPMSSPSMPMDSDNTADSSEHWTTVSDGSNSLNNSPSMPATYADATATSNYCPVVPALNLMYPDQYYGSFGAYREDAHVPILEYPTLSDPSPSPSPSPSPLESSDSVHQSTRSRLAANRHARRPQSGTRAIPRPSNAFMLFRSDFLRRGVIPKNVESKQQNLSRIAGDLWHCLPDDQKEVWKARAREEQRLHQLKYPDYRFKPTQRARKSKSQNVEEEEDPKTRATRLRKIYFPEFQEPATPPRIRRKRASTSKKVHQAELMPPPSTPLTLPLMIKEERTTEDDAPSMSFAHQYRSAWSPPSTPSSSRSSNPATAFASASAPSTSPSSRPPSRFARRMLDAVAALPFRVPRLPMVTDQEPSSRATAFAPVQLPLLNTMANSDPFIPSVVTTDSPRSAHLGFSEFAATTSFTNPCPPAHGISFIPFVHRDVCSGIEDPLAMTNTTDSEIETSLSEYWRNLVAEIPPYVPSYLSDLGFTSDAIVPRADTK